MSHTVISEALIVHAVEDDRAAAKDENAPEDTYPPIVLSQLETLRLSFKEIRCIDNLAGLNNLTKLCLDNNVIEKIEHLDTLTNLRWLDLSFNNIKKVEGLDNLVNLKDLSLYKNQIEVLEGLEGCKNSIECLSLGMNNITEVESAKYLRSFKNLKFLNFKGNPMCRELDYKKYVLSHLDNLVYLDYLLIDQSDVVAAKEAYQPQLLELRREEEIIREREEQAQKVAEHMSMLKEANLDLVETLFDDMLAEDAEMPKLKLLPNVADLIDEYRDTFSTTVEEFKSQGIKEQQRKDSERASLDAALKELRVRSQRETIKLVRVFEDKKKALFVKARNFNPAVLPRLDVLRESNRKLLDQCMEIEIKQVDLFHSLLDTWESTLQKLKSENSERKMNFWRELSNFEKSFNDAVREHAQEMNERLTAGDEEEELPEELRYHLVGEGFEALTAAIGTSLDNHQGLFYSREETMNSREDNQFVTTRDKYKDEEYTRNRDRVAEISNMVEQNETDIERVKRDVEEQNDEDEDDRFK